MEGSNMNTDRVYEFSAGTKPRKKHAPVTKNAAELRVLREKQRRWLSRIKRAMTAISKLDRRIKRLE
jgi:hypothetical protein